MTPKAPPSIRRQLMAWVLGSLSAGGLVLLLAAFWLTRDEIDEVLDDSLRQTALLLADRDLAGALPTSPPAHPLSLSDTESKLVAIARRRDGTLLFSSQPELALRFEPEPGASVQPAGGQRWHVFTVVQDDRIVQVVQPVSVRNEAAAEAASQLLLPLLLLVGLIGALLVVASRRGLRPLAQTSAALAERDARSLAPLDETRVPAELRPLVQTLNELLHRLEVAFENQRRFVADAAHELRSPVTALQLQLQVLERSRDPAERALATAELAAGIARTRRLIAQLLDLSRSSADGALPLVPESLALGELARTIVARWSVEAERRQIDLGAETRTDARIEGDREQLEMLLGNLVENALRYTPGGGTVDVVATVIDGAPTLEVVDNGPGIAADERTRVFDRFYRSPEAMAGGESGSGLGLAIVKAIADRHGAAVSLHDGRGGSGLEVRVRFPAAA